MSAERMDVARGARRCRGGSARHRVAPRGLPPSSLASHEVGRGERADRLAQLLPSASQARPAAPARPRAFGLAEVLREPGLQRDPPSGSRKRDRIRELGAKPGDEAGHRRERHEGASCGSSRSQVLDHLLDQEVAERDAAQARLAVRDRVEHRGRRPLGGDRRAVGRKERTDRRGTSCGSAPPRRRSAAPPRAPGGRSRSSAGRPARAAGAGSPSSSIAMHRLVLDDLLEHVRRASTSRSAAAPGSRG